MQGDIGSFHTTLFFIQFYFYYSCITFEFRQIYMHNWSKWRSDKRHKAITMVGTLTAQFDHGYERAAKAVLHLEGVNVKSLCRRSVTAD